MDTAELGTNHRTNDARDRLVADLKLVIKDAEDLLKNTGQQTSEGFKNAKAKFESTLNSAKNELHNIEESVVVKTKEVAQVTDTFVKEHPWQSVGIGAAIGLICGILISRR